MNQIKGLNFRWLISPGVLIFLVSILVYGDVLLEPDKVIGHLSIDPATELYNRQFIFGELRHGNFALWNPHLLSGYPFFAGFQTWLLYPPAYLFLLLPVGVAFNLIIVLHLFLLGWFTYLWTMKRGLHSGAGLLAASLIMLGAPVTLQIYGGHIVPLAAMAWTPLVLLSLEALIKNPSCHSFFSAAFALAMQIMAGFPQHVFYTGLAVLCFVVPPLLRDKHMARKTVVLGACCATAVAVCAVQILTSIQASGETIRAGGTSFRFASTFSFPPENFATLVAPWFFGNTGDIPYWGRWYFWEMSFFIGVGTLFLACYGALYGTSRRRLLALFGCVAMVLIAMGSHTPLYGWMFRYLPVVGSFRASSRALYETSLFLVLLAAMGFDRLLRSPVATGRAAVAGVFAGALLGVASAWVKTSGQSADGAWARMLLSIRNGHESYLAPLVYGASDFIEQSSALAAGGLLQAAALSLGLALLFAGIRRYPRLAGLLAVVAVMEVFVFAREVRSTFQLSALGNPTLQRFLETHPGDYRIMQTGLGNSANALGAQDISGYDSFRLRRYDEFMAWTQGRNPDSMTSVLEVNRYHPLFRILRCTYLSKTQSDGTVTISDLPPALPHLLMIGRYSVVKERDAILRTMDRRDFEPWKTVVLEEEPSPVPVESASHGKASITRATADCLTIEATTPAPTLLLVTDSYSKGWRAVALPGSSQQQYSVMPADYVLRAIPLAAGHHVFRLEYSPVGFVVGKWISLASLVICIAAILWNFVRARIRNPQSAIRNPDMLV